MSLVEIQAAIRRYICILAYKSPWRCPSIYLHWIELGNFVNNVKAMHIFRRRIIIRKIYFWKIKQKASMQNKNRIISFIKQKKCLWLWLWQGQLKRHLHFVSFCFAFDVVIYFVLIFVHHNHHHYLHYLIESMYPFHCNPIRKSF